MHRCFFEAKSLQPKNFDFQLRYAQSFFDYPDSNKSRALIAWKQIENNFPDRTTTEKDYFKLCQAKVLLELNRKEDASKLIKNVSSNALKQSKDLLLLKVRNSEKANSPTQKKKKKSSFNWNHKNFIPSDPHLERLRKLTGRLIEEKMLSELRSDAIKASYDQSGEIKLELTNLPK
jgi:hypothetical protein